VLRWLICFCVFRPASQTGTTAYELACEHGHPQAAQMVTPLDNMVAVSPLAAALRNPFALCRGRPRP
jgi:hypothetical protein